MHTTPSSNSIIIRLLGFCYSLTILTQDNIATNDMQPPNRVYTHCKGAEERRSKYCLVLHIHTHTMSYTCLERMSASKSFLCIILLQAVAGPLAHYHNSHNIYLNTSNCPSITSAWLGNLIGSGTNLKALQYLTNLKAPRPLVTCIIP